ncbi:MAG: hypothetical protein ABIQ88_11340 [Chitinophagaceae bacterium]
MKYNGSQTFIKYLYENFIANFVGFAIGMAATRLVSHFFVTRNIKNLWGLAAKRTVIDKKTFSNLELLISVVIGFIVFEILSKWIKKKLEEIYPSCKATVLGWMGRRNNVSKEIN